MPMQDGTGPDGEGQLTGRGLGPCGRGFRRGLRRGFGRGFGRYFFRDSSYDYEPTPLTKKEQKELLNQEAKELETELKRIKELIKEVDE